MSPLISDMENSTWTKWIANPGHVRVVALEATRLARELVAQQGLTGLSERGLAEAVVGSLLIASSHKSNESINMNAKGSGPFRQAIIDASPEGRVRGFLIEEPERTKQYFFGTGYWGRGLLSILYSKNSEGKMPYTGMVPIETGFLDEAVNDYYRDSEQLVCKVGYHVETGPRGLLKVRGVLLQAMGGAKAEEAELVNAVQVGQLRRFAAEFTSPAELNLGELLPGLEFKAVETTPLLTFCTCSQERIERALVLTGEEGIVEALGDDPKLEIICDFCRKKYEVTATRVSEIFSPAKPIR